MVGIEGRICKGGTSVEVRGRSADIETVNQACVGVVGTTLSREICICRNVCEG